MKCYGKKIESYFLILNPIESLPSKLDGIEIVGPTHNYRGHNGSHTQDSAAHLIAIQWKNLPNFQWFEHIKTSHNM